MSQFIINYEDIQTMKFTQASVYIDACFILAYLDANDFRGDHVSYTLEKWKNDNISIIAISNHVYSEVVHTLFKNHIRNVIFLAYKINKSKVGKRAPFKPTEDQITTVGDFETANRLLRLIPLNKLELFMKTGELIYSIDNLIKEYKAQYPDHRDPLQNYYDKALEVFNQFIYSLTSIFNFKVEIAISDEDVMNLSQVYMRLLQLEATDALHIAITMKNEYNYFATLDNDFVTNYYENDQTLQKLRIIKIA